MILPTKHIPLDHTLLWAGMDILKSIRERPMGVSELWKDVKSSSSAITTYQRFVLTLDMLYFLGLVVFKKNKIELSR